MKKTFTLFAFASICVALTSCGTKEEEKNIEAPAGMVALDLSNHGKQFSIFVPDTTTEKLEVVEQSWGALEIKVGKHFNISITEDPGDITYLKSQIKSNDVNVFKSYITDEPETIMWESAITVPEFHFYTIQKAAGNTFIIQDVVSSDDPFNKEEIQKMLDSAKKLVEKPKPNA